MTALYTLVAAAVGLTVGLALFTTWDASSQAVITSRPTSALTPGLSLARQQVRSAIASQNTGILYQEPSTPAAQEELTKVLGHALISFAGAFAGVYAAAMWLRRPRTTISIAGMSGRTDEEADVNRRHALIGLSTVAVAVGASPASAGLFGFGEDSNVVYAQDSQKMLTEIKSVLVLDSNDPSKQDQIAVLRRDMNGFIAKYRRDPQFSGRASFGNMYSVINAIAGHYTNFGTKTPIPKKRATQIVTEINTAEQLLTRGR